MSKTHKITQLKKRIAELEKKLNRLEILARSFHVQKVTAYPVKAERHLSRFDCEEYNQHPLYRQYVIEQLLHEIIRDPAFCRCVRIDERDNRDSYFPEKIVRASIMVLPSNGDILEAVGLEFIWKH